MTSSTAPVSELILQFGGGSTLSREVSAEYYNTGSVTSHGDISNQIEAARVIEHRDPMSFFEDADRNDRKRSPNPGGRLLVPFDKTKKSPKPSARKEELIFQLGENDKDTVEADQPDQVEVIVSDTGEVLDA